MAISYLGWACSLGLLIVVVVGAKALWESKRAPIFVLREEAEIRVRRIAPIALALLVVNVSLLAWSRQGSATSPEIISTSTPTPTSIPATPVPFSTPTPTLTPTATPVPTRQTPTPTIASPPASPTEEFEGSFEVTTLAQGVSEEHLPLEPGDVFPEGTKQVYVFFSYTGIEMGTPWTQAWYQGEQELWSQTEEWRLGREGSAWVYMEVAYGFPPGQYEVRLYIDDRLQETAEFAVQPL